MPGRRALASTFSTASARPNCCISSCRTRPATSDTALPAARCRATRCGLSMRQAATCPMAKSANSWSMRRRRAKATGISAAKAARTFEGHWTRTGDKYIRDADGRYTFCGRSDDMFKVSGIWVSPFEVESALITHPAVLEAAVVPEADRGRLVQAEGVRGAARRRQDRRPRRGVEGARQAEDRRLEISALDRDRRGLAENRDRQDPAVQAAGADGDDCSTSSSAKAGDPVSQRLVLVPRKAAVSGCPACAGRERAM